MAVWLLKTLLGRFLIINSLLTHLDISKYNYFCTRSLYSQRNLFNNNISNGSESRFTVSVIAQSESRTTLSHSQLSNNYRLIGWFSRVLKYSNTHVVVSNISGYAASYWDIHVPRASRADPPPPPIYSGDRSGAGIIQCKSVHATIARAITLWKNKLSK